MSTERKDIQSNASNAIHVTSFSGGERRGRCLQLTQRAADRPDDEHGYGYVQLDKGQALALIAELAEWVGESS